MAILGALVGGFVGAISACFTPPADAVLFACEFEGDDRCPPDYSCEADNCCHRVGSDVEANFGSCALGGNSGGSGTTGTGGNPTTETGSDTGSTSG
jgi:hypothetical protein